MSPSYKDYPGLLPCPFCGETPPITQGQSGGYFMIHVCPVLRQDLSIRGYFKQRRTIKRRWNTRAALPAPNDPT